MRFRASPCALASLALFAAGHALFACGGDTAAVGDPLPTVDAGADVSHDANPHDASIDALTNTDGSDGATDAHADTDAGHDDAGHDDAGHDDAGHDDAATDSSDGSVAKSHLRWRRGVGAYATGIYLDTDSFWVEGDGVRLTGNTGGLLTQPVTLLVSSSGYVATPLQGLPAGSTAMNVYRDGSGNFTGLVSRKGDAGQSSALASFDSTGALLSAVNLLGSGAYAQLGAFDSLGRVFGTYTAPDTTIPRLVGYDWSGQLFSNSPPLVSYAGNGVVQADNDTLLTTQAADGTTPARIVAWNTIGTKLWATDLADAQYFYDIGVTGTRVAIAHWDTTGSYVTTLSTVDGSILSSFPIHHTLRCVTPLANGGSYVAGTDGVGPFVEKLDASGAVLWHDALQGPSSTLVLDIKSDANGNALVLVDTAGSTVVSDYVASFGD